jgi:hypothetical protein
MPVTKNQARALASMRAKRHPKKRSYHVKHNMMGIKGKGAYALEGNQLAVDSVPDFQVKKRETIIYHREYITDLVSSSSAATFLNTTFNINPGLAATFPWLSAVAGNYEEYELMGMVFEVKSISSDALNSTNTALGYVAAAVQYNANGAPFVTKQQIENYEFAVSCKPSQSIICPVECDRKETTFGSILNVRTGAVSGTQDLRLYDWGVLNLVSGGFQGTSVKFAELWCSYKVRLLKPRLNMTGLNYGDHYHSAGTNLSTTYYFDSPIPAVSSSSNFGTVLTNTTITIPSWYTGGVMVLYALKGNSTAYSAVTFTPSAGAVALNIVAQNTLPYSAINVTSTGQYQSYFVSCTNGGLLTVSGGTLVASPTAFDLYIVSIPFNN